MYKILGLFTLLMLFSSGCWGENIKPFSSDGCSLFPDASLITKIDWCDCCYQHDLAYWRGGTKEQRNQADLALKQCIMDKTENKHLANMMFKGVQFGGSPYFYTWYRWGYGWSYGRGFTELNRGEIKQADDALILYAKTSTKQACPLN